MAKRVAALYDIHGNLPALEAVLDDVRNVGVDHIVVGGDVLPGPMPQEALTLLFALDIPVQFIYGNGELAVLAQIDARDSGVVKYWGTVSGNPLPEPLQEVLFGRAARFHLTTRTRCAAGLQRWRWSSRWARYCFVMALLTARLMASPG